MNMRISNNTVDTKVASSAAGEVRKPLGADDGRPAAAVVERRSQSTVSDLAVRLKSLEQEISKQEPFDKKRVETIRQAIKDGHYKIDPEKIADAIIETAVSLTSGSKHKG